MTIPEPGKLYVWDSPVPIRECPVCGMRAHHYHPEGWQKPKDLIMGLPIEIPQGVNSKLTRDALQKRMTTLLPDFPGIPYVIDAIMTAVDEYVQCIIGNRNLNIVKTKDCTCGSWAKNGARHKNECPWNK